MNFQENLSASLREYEFQVNPSCFPRKGNSMKRIFLKLIVYDDFILFIARFPLRNSEYYLRPFSQILPRGKVYKRYSSRNPGEIKKKKKKRESERKIRKEKKNQRNKNQHIYRHCNSRDFKVRKESSTAFDFKGGQVNGCCPSDAVYLPKVRTCLISFLP